MYRRRVYPEDSDSRCRPPFPTENPAFIGAYENM
jgi:hypothetical protein